MRGIVKAINGVFGITNPDREAQTGHYIRKSPAWWGTVWGHAIQSQADICFQIPKGLEKC
jgi:hypothetical protein